MTNPDEIDIPFIMNGEQDEQLEKLYDALMDMDSEMKGELPFCVNSLIEDVEKFLKENQKRAYQVHINEENELRFK